MRLRKKSDTDGGDVGNENKSKITNGYTKKRVFRLSPYPQSDGSREKKEQKGFYWRFRENQNSQMTIIDVFSGLDRHCYLCHFSV